MRSVIQKKSYDSVQIFWLNKNLVKKRLERSIRGLVRDKPEIEKITLFGSFSEDRGAVGSDIDLLIIVDHCREEFIDRASEYQDYFSNIGLDTDIFVYSEDEIERSNSIVENAFKTGKVLFEKRDIKVDQDRNKKKIQAWIESWRMAGPELESMRREKIRNADTTRSILNLDDAFHSAILQQKLNNSSGLVEQQKFFNKILQKEKKSL